MHEDINEIIRKNKLKRANKFNSTKDDASELSPNLKYIKGLISRVLISVIFVLGSIIFTNISTKNKELYQEKVLQNSLSFTKINNLYQSIFGKIDITNKGDDSQTVFKNNIKYSNIENYKNSSKLTVNQNEIINAISSGIVVFIGEKEELGPTIIVQGNDGVDIWYSNITDTDIKVYDYISSGSILGTSNSDYIYLTFNKDGEYINYEEYQKLI